MDDKLELKEILAAIDTNSKELWNDLSDNQRKELIKNFYTIDRFVTNVNTSDTKIQEHFILMVNELYNKNYFLLQKNHPELLWKLICACSHDSKRMFTRKWLAFKKKAGESKIEKFLMEIYPNAKLDDIRVLNSLMSKDEIKELAEMHGYDDKFIKNLFK